MRLLNFVLFVVMCSLLSCKKQETKKEIDSEVISTSSKSENVSLLTKQFDVPNKEGEAISRAIWLYLPPNYTTTTERFPVIYMHDGQNLFDKKTSFAGEWGVDEILNEVYAKTKRGFIVVGINNVGKERLNEYSPWKNDKYGGGSGDTYIQMIIQQLKPYIDANYRTKPDAEHTGIIGSSMGGLISYYAGLKYPDVFGKLGVMSPSFWFSEEVITFTTQNASLKNTKMYLLLGDQEGMTDEFNRVSQLLLANGFPKENLAHQIVEGGKHNEAFWHSQFLPVIQFLYTIDL